MGLAHPETRAAALWFEGRCSIHLSYWRETMMPINLTRFCLSPRISSRET
jgi:hypothetical protein